MAQHRDEADPGALVEIGVVARAHGVRGELRVVPHDPESTTLLSVDAVFVDGVRRDLLAARPVPGGVLVAVSGVVDRDAAEALRGRPIAVSRADLHLEAGEVLVADLVGCAAELRDGTPWGTIAAVETGAQWRLVVEDGDVERLLPLVPELVVEIDLPRRRVVVAPPEGLPEQRRRS